jgi:LL-diaminopimelate aminotransferase
MITPARRMSILMPHFFATLNQHIAAMTASGLDVIRLDEGAPDLPPAPFIIQALTEAAARPDAHGYQPHRGPLALRQAWAGMYRRLYAIDLDPEREVIPLLGSKEGIFHLLQALINPGDLVLVPDPGYVTYTRGTRFAGGEVDYFPLAPERGWLPDLDAIPAEIAERARLIFLNYPNNPTGAIASLDFFADAVNFARRHQLLLCHDAAYAQVTFDGMPAPSPLQIPGASDCVVEFNTLSKSHNMAGWRVGVAVGNAEVLKTLYTLKTNADSGHFYPILHAAAVALDGDQGWLAERNEIYRQRRDVILRTLSSLGLAVEAPGGSLYVWSCIPPGYDPIGFTTAALEAVQVSFTPGSLFGEQGEGYVRIAFTAPLERIVEAMERLGSWAPWLWGGKI